MYATLSQEGTVTIPQEIRQRLKLDAGDRVNFLISNGDMVRLVPERRAKSVAGMNEWHGKPLTLKDMDDAAHACPRVPGRLKGRIRMSDDFDEWPDDIARALGMR